MIFNKHFAKTYNAFLKEAFRKLRKNFTKKLHVLKSFSQASVQGFLSRYNLPVIEKLNPITVYFAAVNVMSVNLCVGLYVFICPFWLLLLFLNVFRLIESIFYYALLGKNRMTVWFVCF